jgi:hypothetical protein
MTDYGQLDILYARLVAGAPRDYDALRKSARELDLGKHTFAVAG